MAALEQNQFVISGQVLKLGNERFSPSGIPHYKIMIEHRSKQWEAGSGRLAACRVMVQFSGESLVSQARQIELGEKIVVKGFLSVPLKTLQSDVPSELRFDPILHAQHIEIMRRAANAHP